MKAVGSQIKNKVRALWADESAQGATEYILILVAVVSVAIMFKERIKSFMQGRLGAVEQGLNQFNVEGG